MRCAVKCCVFIEIYGEFETFSTSSAPSGHLLLKEKALVCANLKQFDKSEFDRILDDKKQRTDKVLPGEVPGRTVLIRGEGVRNCRSSERINFSASPGRFFGYFLVDTRK